LICEFGDVAAMRKARDEAARRIFVTSHRFGSASKPAVLIPALAAAEARSIDVKLYYGVPAASGDGARAAASTIEAATAGIKIQPIHEPRVHAKLLAWDDDDLIVTSQNWLSADPGEGSPRREIGIFVNASGIGRRVIDRFNYACGIT
jgi:cardiolipin synthase A/B